MTLSAGTRLSTYEIGRPLGAGGMGEVYRARDMKLSREVAIKVLLPELARDAERVARFETEARAASALNHPHIVTIFEIGQANGTSFIAMELVEGRTLRDLLSDGAVPAKRLLSAAAQMAEGLGRAHAAGIVHRDLKPENIMVTRDGFVKILDFGLAKLVRTGFERSQGAERATMPRATKAGTILGTVGYMSPEQASGEPADFRSDQFSLGSILYEMATGRRAFDRPTDAQTLSAIIESEPEPIAAIAPRTPAALLSVVERCLAKDPEDRYGSTKDLARDLAAVRDQSSGVSAPGAATPPGRRLRLAPAALIGAATCAAAIAVLTFLAGQRLQARHDRNAPPAKRTTLTFRRGYLTGARFAPDGQTIVYSACWDGRRSEVFTAHVGSTESRRTGIEDAEILAVSSTGEMALSMGCSRQGNPCMGTLARAPLAGGAPRELLGDVVAADWSPDGKELAVAAMGRIEYPVGKVLYENEGRGFVSAVRVSPDGNLVAFLDHPRRDGERGILTVVDRTGKKRVLTDEWARLGPILWSPTGAEIFFSRWGEGERRGVDLAGHTRSAAWIPGLDDVTRDGLFLDAGMFSENYRGLISARVPDQPDERNLSWLGGSVAADLSHDGRHLLLYEESRNPNGEVYTTYLRETGGSDAVTLGEGRALALSPDGGWALVTRPSPETHLVLLPTRAGEPRRLAGGGMLYRKATFFPDGGRILFDVDDKDGNPLSFVQDVPDGAPKPIGDVGTRAVVVSPDGRSIAARTEEGIFAYPVEEEGAPRRIPGGLPTDIPIQWSSDGTTLYVQATEEPNLTLYRLNLATGRRDRWKELAPRDRTGLVRYGPRIRGPGLSVTPDGRFYAYTYFTDQSRLVLAEVGPDWWK